jgi:hypothetical protein
MDIQWIFKTAKEHILEQGEHVPTLFVEFKGLTEMVIAPLLVYGGGPQTTLDKQKMFFTIGRSLGKEYLGIDVSIVAFVSEAWVSTVKKGESSKYNAPSQDPNRKEMLLVNVLDASKPPHLTQSLYRAEMLRDGSGQLVDLLADSKPLEGGYSKLLTAFLAGACSTKLSDKEFDALLAKYTH